MDFEETSVNVDPSNITKAQYNSIQTLQSKIHRAEKRIQDEQKKRDQNVEDYLKMAAVAQRNQLTQVKAVFEKKNVKAATHIAALQKKLERYKKELQEIETESQTVKNVSPAKSRIGGTPGQGTSSPKGGTLEKLESEASGSSNASSHRLKLQNVSQGIKSVGGNLKDGISGISGTVINKPKEKLKPYISRQKFGSADNIPSHVGNDSDTNNPRGGHRHGSANLPSDVGELTHGAPTKGTMDQENCSECSESARSSSLGHDAKTITQGGVGTISHDLQTIILHLNELKEDVNAMKEEIDSFKNHVSKSSQDSAFLLQGLQEERFRAERLEEQVNDLTELHQAETANLKQALSDAEEKLSYQSEERLRDLAELLDACHAKISRLEQQQQQLVTIEGIDNSTARALAVKLVNVGLTMLQLVLLLVATASSALSPFLGSRLRLFTSISVGLGAFLIHKKWPHVHDVVLNYSSDLINKIL